MPDYSFNPSSSVNPSSAASPGERRKWRIYSVFKPTIVLDELSIDQTKEGGTGILQKPEDINSVLFPLIRINDYMVNNTEIEYFRIDSTGRIPSITLSCAFGNDIFIKKNMPKDGDIISVAIRPKSDLLKPIRNDYVITGVSVIKKSATAKTGTAMTFFGELFVPGIHGFRGNRYYNSTSMEALKRVAEFLHLGFNTNEDSTDDQQMWYIFGSMEKGIAKIVSRAWNGSDSFFDWWIDVYYNLNFVNVQKQLLAQEDEIDLAASISNVDADYYWGEKNETVSTAKVFSNFTGFRTTSFFILNWKPINRSSDIVFRYGTFDQQNFFEHNDVLYKDPALQKAWSIRVEPSYDEEKIKSHILLRGRAKWIPELNEGQRALSNYSYTDLYYDYSWAGIQYTVSNPGEDHTAWTGNHHRNYLRSKSQNLINLVELDKLNVEITVQGVNLNIIRGDKMPVVLTSIDPIENAAIEEELQTNEILDKFYSGWYYVKGFSLSWTPGVEGQILSDFSQTFTLTRREWPTPIVVEPAK